MHYNPFPGWKQCIVNQCELSSKNQTDGDDTALLIASTNITEKTNEYINYSICFFVLFIITSRELREISVAFSAIGALLVALAIVLSLTWQPLP